MVRRMLGRSSAHSSKSHERMNESCACLQNAPDFSDYRAWFLVQTQLVLSYDTVKVRRAFVSKSLADVFKESSVFNGESEEVAEEVRKKSAAFSRSSWFAMYLVREEASSTLKKRIVCRALVPNEGFMCKI